MAGVGSRAGGGRRSDAPSRDEDARGEVAIDVIGRISARRTSCWNVRLSCWLRLTLGASASSFPPSLSPLQPRLRNPSRPIQTRSPPSRPTCDAPLLISLSLSRPTRPRNSNVPPVCPRMRRRVRLVLSRASRPVESHIQQQHHHQRRRDVSTASIQGTLGFRESGRDTEWWMGSGGEVSSGDLTSTTVSSTIMNGTHPPASVIRASF